MGAQCSILRARRAAVLIPSHNLAEKDHKEKNQFWIHVQVIKTGSQRTTKVASNKLPLAVAN